MALPFKTKKNPLIPEEKPVPDTTQSKVPEVPVSEGAQGGVRFNPDNTVDVRIGSGTSERLSKEEYKTYQGEGGKKTPQIEKLRQLSENETLKQNISTQLKRGATIQEITKNLLLQQNQAQQMAQVEQNQLQPSSDITPTTEDTNVYPEGSIPSKIAKAFGNETPQQKINEKLITRPIGKIYDFAQSIFSGGKGLEQKEAEKTLSQLDTEINQDLALIKSGLKNPSDVKRKIADARSALVRLDNSVKGLNKYNLRYFVLEGADVRTQILNYQDQLKDYEAMLQAATLENQLAESQANFNQQ